MSKRESIKRYILIVNKLSKKPASFAEIDEYLQRESEFYGYNFNVSKRTFQRDVEDIATIFDIEIEYNFSQKVYELKNNGNQGVTQRMLEAFETFDALNLTSRVSKFIHFEQRKPQGTEHLTRLIHAIEKQHKIQFDYKKFWQDQTSTRIVEPYALKEFKHRWYLLAKDETDNEIKSFGLDRISELFMTSQKFKYPKDFDLEKHYLNCFGIIAPTDETPEEVILSFTPYQGKYIKSLPLHSSQEILIDNDLELRIKLQVYVTHDLFMELLSFGQNIKIIAPQKLIDKYQTTMQAIQKKY